MFVENQKKEDSVQPFQPKSFIHFIPNINLSQTMRKVINFLKGSSHMIAFLGMFGAFGGAVQANLYIMSSQIQIQQYSIESQLFFFLNPIVSHGLLGASLGLIFSIFVKFVVNLI